MEPSTAYLSGTLYLSRSGWLLMAVPNALGYAAFSSLDEPGIEMPKSDTTGRYNAHVSVMRPEEIAKIGGPEKITERGKRVRYTLGKVKSVKPAGWGEMSKCWFIEVNSPELSQIRRSYGLSSLPNEDRYAFHITFAVRRKGVLLVNGVIKQADADQCPVCGGPVAMRCRCRLGDRTCASGHEWYTCPVHRDRVLLGSGHSDDRGFECRCDSSKSAEQLLEAPPADAVLQRLLLAKAYSDRKQYDQKHAVLRELILQHPQQFVVDDPTAKFPGITHTPTQFRLHTTPQVAALIGMGKAANSYWRAAAATLSDPETVQHVQRGFETEPVVSGPLLTSLFSYPARGLVRGMRYSREAANQQRLADAIDPAAAAARFRQQLAGGSRAAGA